MVRLRPMDPVAWEAWRKRAIADYAREMADRGTWPASEAASRAATLFAGLVPEGLATVGHLFREVVADDGSVVGTVWIETGREAGVAFLWDIVIEARYRGRGFGRAALGAIEQLAQDAGAMRIQLHVFGDNDVARHLYRSAGWTETDVTMEKEVGS